MRRSAIFSALAFAGFTLTGLTLSACQKDVQAPTEQGVCYRAVLKKDGGADFIEVARKQEHIEDCAARLDEVRYRFLSMGGSRYEIVGAYQGRFLFIDQAGLSYAQSLHGNQYTALGRLPDGRLAVPGLMPALPPEAQGKKAVTITQDPQDRPAPPAKK